MNQIIFNPPRTRKATTVPKTRRRRKWGSPKQRAALKRMLAANRRGKSPRRRAVRRNPPKGAITVPRKTRRRSVARVFRARRRGRTSSGRGLGEFLPPGTIHAVAGGVAGFIGVQYAVDKIPGLPASMKVGPARMATKAAVGIAAGYLARRFAGKQIGNAIGVGALISVGLDAVNLALNKPAAGVSGYSPGGDNQYAQLAGASEYGMGEYEAALAGDPEYAV